MQEQINSKHASAEKKGRSGSTSDSFSFTFYASSPEGLSIFKEQIVFTFKAQSQSHPAGLGRGRHQNVASQQKLNNP